MVMKASKPVAFVLIAFLIGGAASQLPFAFADSSANPLQSIWDAINALSNKQEDLQAQIDELRTTIENDRNSSIVTQVPQSETTIKIELEGGEQPSATIFHLIASNAGPNNAVGVKVTLFYEMPLFEVESVSGEQCEDMSRGIIQCFIGTIGPGEEYPIIIVANARALEEKSSIVADISSITTDTDVSNNHVNLPFVTGEIAKAGGMDSEVVPTEDEIGANGVGAPEEPAVSSSNSQTSGDEQSSAKDDNALKEETENNSNSTQSGGSDQKDESVNEQQQSQGSEGVGGEEQNSEEAKDNTDDGTEQESQTTNGEENAGSESSGDDKSSNSSEGEESSQ